MMATRSAFQKTALLKELAWLVSQIRKDFYKNNNPTARNNEIAAKTTMRNMLSDCDLQEHRLFHMDEEKEKSYNLTSDLLETLINDKHTAAINASYLSITPEEKKKANQLNAEVLYLRQYQLYTQSPLYQQRPVSLNLTPVVFTGPFLKALREIERAMDEHEPNRITEVTLPEIIVPLLSVFTLSELSDIFNLPLPRIKNALAQARNPEWVLHIIIGGAATLLLIAIVAFITTVSIMHPNFFNVYHPLEPVLMCIGVFSMFCMPLLPAPFMERFDYDQKAKNTPNEAVDVKSALDFEFRLGENGITTEQAPESQVRTHSAGASPGVGAMSLINYRKEQEQSSATTNAAAYVVNNDVQQPLLRQGANRG